MSNTKRYLFLTAWVEGSDSADEPTQVNEQSDLMPQFRAGNQHVFALEVLAPNENIALAFAYMECWENNYTAHDTVSYHSGSGCG